MMSRLPSNEPRRIADVLSDKKRAFGELSNQVAERVSAKRQQHPNDEGLQLIEEFGNAAIELVQALEVQAATPRHVHGPTYRTDDKSDNRQYQEHLHQNVNIDAKTELTVIQDRIYKVSSDLIISTSGQFAFRPKSRSLHMACGQFELTEAEANRLYDRMKFDYGL